MYNGEFYRANDTVGINNLYSQLLSIINGESSDNANEREKLLNQLNSLESSTAAYIQDLKDETNTSITNLRNDTINSINDLKDYVDEQDSALQGQIDNITDHITATDGTVFDFGYYNGSYGYYVNGTFKPF